MASYRSGPIRRLLSPAKVSTHMVPCIREIVVCWNDYHAIAIYGTLAQKSLATPWAGDELAGSARKEQLLGLATCMRKIVPHRLSSGASGMSACVFDNLSFSHPRMSCSAHLCTFLPPDVGVPGGVHLLRGTKERA